jgi:hypothetical protein
MAKRTVSFPVWDERVDGPDEERKIVEHDWRDRDYVVQLDGLTMYSNDLEYQENHASSEPRWELGCEARDSNNHVVLTFGGEPCEPFRAALLEGRVLFGVAGARDCQRHAI